MQATGALPDRKLPIGNRVASRRQQAGILVAVFAGLVLKHPLDLPLVVPRKTVACRSHCLPEQLLSVGFVTVIDASGDSRKLRMRLDESPERI